MTLTDAKPLILVDGSSYLYRAFHALPSLSNSKGEPTGAVYGVTNMLRRLLTDYQPEYVAVVFDAKGKTFRDEMYPQYKANRPPMPEELAQQIKPIHAVVGALGFPILEVAGVEADDVIGTLVRQAVQISMPVLIATSDKDMTQLVSAQVSVANTMDGSELDPVGVEAKFGVPPSQIVDYLALIGDTVDNVPGVPKVGPKTAARWLKEYGSLDDVMNRSDEIKGKVGENLRSSLEHLPLSRALVTIKCDVNLGLGVPDLRRREADIPVLRKLYSELEFKTWLRELSSGDDEHGSSVERPELRYDTILDERRLAHWLDRLRDAELFAFDTETTSLDYMEAELVGVSFSVEPGEAAYVPVGHDYAGAPRQLSRDHVLQLLSPMLEDPQVLKLGQNLKYDMSVLARYGICMAGIRFDTMLESYVLDSTATRHDMDSLALKYLNHETIHFEDVAGKGAKQLTFNEVPLEQAAPYAAEDADVTLRLHHVLWPRVAAVETLRDLFDDIEMPLVPVLSKMERNGVLIDAHMLAGQSSELAARMHELEQEAHAVAGRPFNLGSPKQIQEILFDDFKLPVRAKTPKGQPSTSESVLQELALDYPLPKLILEHRAVSKLKSTYTEALPACIHPLSGRVHTSYQQAVASTGRLSSTEPNLQNIPIRTPEGRRVRKAFVSPPGYKLVAADYSQIELRIMAHLSGDDGLRRAFGAGEDVHRATASDVFGVTAATVTDDQRRSAKAINFGLIYGMSAFGLARQLGIERAQAQEYVDLYFTRYPQVKTYMDSTRSLAREQGYVETVFGRRLYLPEINSRNVHRRQYAERTAINAPMQGTAADIIKRAMLRVDAWLIQSGIDARMIMQVHDELVFEVSEDAVDQTVQRVRELMVGAAELTVPLVVDIGIGDNWDEAH